MSRIDAHQHYWSLSRGDYGWLTPALSPIYRDFGPADLKPLLADHGIGRTIAVQAAPTEAETRFLLDIAEREDSVAGVVGWTDFEAADAPEAIARLSADRKLAGLRPMVHDIADPRWLEGPALSAAFEAMTAHRLVFDALLKPRHLEPMLRVVERHPELSVVIDHGAKPDLVSGDLEQWRHGIAALARHRQVVCKLSGLVTEAAPGWTVATLRPAVEHLLDCFEPQRLLWGSDWPVVTLACDYRRWFETAEALLAGLSATEREAVFGGNAARIYLSR